MPVVEFDELYPTIKGSSTNLEMILSTLKIVTLISSIVPSERCVIVSTFTGKGMYD